MSMIIVDGTIAPWLWNGSSYYQGSLIDPGIFAPAGTSLTGDAIEIVWSSDPSVTAAITINGVTMTLGPTALHTVMDTGYQNITVSLGPNVAVNSYDPTFAAQYNPHGIGGSLELVGLDGYFYVTSMVDPPSMAAAAVPGPVAGEGWILLGIMLVFVIWLKGRDRRESLTPSRSRSQGTCLPIQR